MTWQEIKSLLVILRSLSYAPVEIVASSWTLFSCGHTGPSTLVHTGPHWSTGATRDPNLIFSCILCHLVHFCFISTFPFWRSSELRANWSISKSSGELSNCQPRKYSPVSLNVMSFLYSFHIVVFPVSIYLSERMLCKDLLVTLDSDEILHSWFMCICQGRAVGMD